MTTIYMKQYDTRPFVRANLLDGEGNTVNLGGASVVFNMENTLTRAAAEVTSPIGGLVTYYWQTTDLPKPGAFDAEFEVTYSDGGVETFPRDEYMKIVVAERQNIVSVLMDPVLENIDVLAANVAAAIGQTTSDRWLDVSGNGDVSFADSLIVTTAKTNLVSVYGGDASAIAQFALAPDAIQDMIDAVTTPAPIFNAGGGVRVYLDLDGSGDITSADYDLAVAILGAV